MRRRSSDSSRDSLILYSGLSAERNERLKKSVICMYLKRLRLYYNTSTFVYKILTVVNSTYAADEALHQYSGRIPYTN